MTWLEPPPSERSSQQSEEDTDSELPAAALLHSCEYCPWGYFGNESSEVDFYTYAALHIEIPPSGKGIREATKPPSTPLGRTAVKRKRAARKRDQEQKIKGSSRPVVGEIHGAFTYFRAWAASR